MPILPRNIAEAIKHLPWRGSAVHIMFFASHVYQVSSKTIRVWYCCNPWDETWLNFKLDEAIFSALNKSLSSLAILQKKEMRKITTHYFRLTSKSFSLYDLTRLHLYFFDMASRWDGTEVGNSTGELAFFRSRNSQNHLKVVPICQCRKTTSDFGYMT